MPVSEQQLREISLDNEGENFLRVDHLDRRYEGRWCDIKKLPQRRGPNQQWADPPKEVLKKAQFYVEHAEGTVPEFGGMRYQVRPVAIGKKRAKLKAARNRAMEGKIKSDVIAEARKQRDDLKVRGMELGINVGDKGHGFTRQTETFEAPDLE